jgi:CHAD domain-containing protein
VRAADLPAAADLLEMRAATPIARLKLRTVPVRVLDGERKTVVRLAVHDAGAELGARLAVTPVRGYDKHLARVRRLVEDDLGLRPARASLADAAVLAAGGTPGGVSSKLDLHLDRRGRADTAAVVVATQLLRAIEVNLPGTLADTDTEFLHDLRVAVRRTRALQRELRKVFPPAELARARAAFKHLQQVTGPTRDLDVHLLDLEAMDDPHLVPLHRLLERERAVEQQRMARALRGARTRRVLDEWSALLAGLHERPPDDRPDATRPIGPVAGKRIRRVYAQMVTMGLAIGDDSPHEALHDLRKKGKELRYLLEFFSSLFDPGEVKPMVKTLKALQDVLGRFQDFEVQAHTLRALGARLAPAGEADALMAIGALVAQLELDQAAARAAFADVFGPFAAKPRRTAVQETFR